MSLELVLLAAALWALVFVPAGYFIRVWLERSTDSARPPGCVEDIYGVLESHTRVADELRMQVGQLKQDSQLMESNLRMMNTEMADFFDKTRKSEERQRGLTRRAEAAIGDEESTELQDQQLLELMEQRQGEPPAGEPAAPMTREEYYRQHST